MGFSSVNSGFSGASTGGGGGGIGGSGTLNFLAKWTPNGANIGNSLVYDNGVSVAIGNSSPTASTAFEIKSTTGGFVFPRMSEAQRDALTAFDGMTVFNTDSFTYDGYAASSWYNFIGSNTSNTANYYPKFVSTSVVTDSLLSDDGTNIFVSQSKLFGSFTGAAYIDFSASGNDFIVASAGTTELSGTNVKISGALQITSGTPGASKVLTSDASGNATWATPATPTLTGSTGDLISFSATDTKSNISAVSAGSYLRSNGTSTLPLWSTLKLPNTGTANYIPYFTSTNTLGESASFKFDPTLKGAATILGTDGGGLKIGSYSATFGGFWSAAVTPSTSNYSLIANATRVAFNAPTDIFFYINDATQIMGMNASGLYIGGASGSASPTAKLTIAAGTATAGKAPLKFTTGTNLTTPEIGAMEYDNTFHLTNSDATRRHIATAPNTTKVTAGAPYTNDGYVVINIGGTDFKVMTTA